MNMSENNELDPIRKKLKEVLVENLSLGDIKPEAIDNDEPLFGGGLNLDSLDAVELVVLVQRNFGVEISDMDVGKTAFQSINTLAKFIHDNPNA